LVPTQLLLHCRRAQRLLPVHQQHQRRLDADLALPRRQVQDAHVLLGRPPGLLLKQRVVSQAEAAGREHLVPVAVAGERARLAHQRVDHVPVVDPAAAAAAQPGQLLHHLLGVVDLDPLSEEPALDPLADQPGRHRVGVAPDVDRAAPVHAYLPALARLQPRRRQRA
jgi:hypothetical protein